MDLRVQGEELAAHLTVGGRVFFDHWRSLCAGRRFPLRADFDPFAVPRHLLGVQLVEVLAGAAPVRSRDVSDSELSFVYRVVGTRETEVRGENPTGRRVEQGFFGGSAERVRANYLTVFRSAAPLLDLEEVETRGGYPVQDVSLFLPLGLPEGLVGQILVYSEQHPLPPG